MPMSRRIWLSLGVLLMVLAGLGGGVAQAASAQAAPLGLGVHAPVSPQSPRWIGPWPPQPPAHIPCCPPDGNPANTPPPPAPFERYFLGDWRLGPAHLPTGGLVGPLLRGYHRTDALSPRRFIDCYWDYTVSGWRYPPNDGFADGRTRVTLTTGQYIDRFGANSGRFLSPFGVLYKKRALPPSNLDTIDPRYPNNYHVFRVLKPFDVDAGAAAPWFGQPGGGLQYVVNPSYVPNPLNERVDTQFLIDHGYLLPVN